MSHKLDRPPFNEDTIPSEEPYPELLFPASIRDNEDVTLAKDGVRLEAFLKRDLQTPLLDNMFNWLWWCGRQMPPRPLNYQLALSRQLVLSENMGHHLVWKPGTMYLKPLPRYLLDYNFWGQHLLCKHEGQCEKEKNSCKRELRENAVGFLHTYVALVQYESDFSIAKSAFLLPENLSWKTWRAFTEQVIKSRVFENVKRRWRFGELRLGRLNLVSRYIYLNLRGYAGHQRTYTEFFQDNIRSLLTFIAFWVLLLGAVQVGLATERLVRQQNFQAFSVAVSVGGLLCALVYGVVKFLFFLILFVDNYRKTRHFNKQRNKKYEDATDSERP